MWNTLYLSNLGKNPSLIMVLMFKWLTWCTMGHLNRSILNWQGLGYVFLPMFAMLMCRTQVMFKHPIKVGVIVSLCWQSCQDCTRNKNLNATALWNDSIRPMAPQMWKAKQGYCSIQWTNHRVANGQKVSIVKQNESFNSINVFCKPYSEMLTPCWPAILGKAACTFIEM